MIKKEKIIKWLKQKKQQAKARGFIIGLSGGIDSAVAAVLAKKTGSNVLGLIMPCGSQVQDEKHAQLLVKKYKIKTKKVKLDKLFKSSTKTYGTNTKNKDLALANIKPRLRMMTLYYYANKLNYLVVGTGNRSELEMGYFTKYGDGGVDLLPLGNLFKKDVYAIANELKIPDEIINKPPSAGLWPGQTDEDEMGITYQQIDDYFSGKKNKLSKNIREEIRRRQKLFKHKLSIAQACK